MQYLIDCKGRRDNKMITFGLVVLGVVLAAQVSSADHLAVPVFRQPYGKGESYIIGGETAVKGQFPHQAAVTIDFHAFCGGSLISKSWVLTAAHCVDGFRQWTVVLGAQNIKDTNEPGRVTIASQKAFFHEEFNSLKLYNDIGVISLSKEVELTDQINIIPLSPKSFQNESFVNKTVRVSGWGKTSDANNAISPTLQFVDMNIISKEECEGVYGDIITNMVYCCSGTERKSTCNGDSGGALTIGTGTNLTQIAIVSFGSTLGCAKGYPTGFTAITFYVDWVSNKTGIPIQDF